MEATASGFDAGLYNPADFRFDNFDGEHGVSAGMPSPAPAAASYCGHHPTPHTRIWLFVLLLLCVKPAPPLACLHPAKTNKKSTAQADVLLHRLYYSTTRWLPGRDAAPEKRDAQDELHSAAQAKTWADGDCVSHHHHHQMRIPWLWPRRPLGPLEPGSRAQRPTGRRPRLRARTPSVCL
jgi:hypothetical protein